MLVLFSFGPWLTAWPPELRDYWSASAPATTTGASALAWCARESRATWSCRAFDAVVARDSDTRWRATRAVLAREGLVLHTLVVLGALGLLVLARWPGRAIRAALAGGVAMLALEVQWSFPWHLGALWSIEQLEAGLAALGELALLLAVVAIALPRLGWHRVLAPAVAVALVLVSLLAPEKVCAGARGSAGVFALALLVEWHLDRAQSTRREMACGLALGLLPGLVLLAAAWWPRPSHALLRELFTQRHLLIYARSDVPLAHRAHGPLVAALARAREDKFYARWVRPDGSSHHSGLVRSIVFARESSREALLFASFSSSEALTGHGYGGDQCMRLSADGSLDRLDYHGMDMANGVAPVRSLDVPLITFGNGDDGVWGARTGRRVLPLWRERNGKAVAFVWHRDMGVFELGSVEADLLSRDRVAILGALAQLGARHSCDYQQQGEDLCSIPLGLAPSGKPCAPFPDMLEARSRPNVRRRVEELANDPDECTRLSAQLVIELWKREPE